VGTELAVDESSFELLENEAGTVEAELVGVERFTVTLFVAWVDGLWMMVGSSEPVGG
jgi:hypothetical protein